LLLLALTVTTHNETMKRAAVSNNQGKTRLAKGKKKDDHSDDNDNDDYYPDLAERERENKLIEAMKEKELAGIEEDNKRKKCKAEKAECEAYIASIQERKAEAELQKQKDDYREKDYLRYNRFRNLGVSPRDIVGMCSHLIPMAEIIDRYESGEADIDYEHGLKTKRQLREYNETLRQAGSP
jgi:hypothetical protein